MLSSLPLDGDYRRAFRGLAARVARSFCSANLREASRSVNDFCVSDTPFFKKSAWPPQIRPKKTRARPFRRAPECRKDGE
jgi:hypothetical protein